jgi:hypothetical protein
MAEIQSISKSIKIKDLRALCLSCNLDTSGTKRDLRNRLELYQMNQFTPSFGGELPEPAVPLPPPPPQISSPIPDDKNKTYDRSLVSEQDYEYEKCLQEDREKELKKIATEDIAAENNNKEITTEDSENDVTIKKIDDEEIYLTKEELREARLKFFS